MRALLLAVAMNAVSSASPAASTDPIAAFVQRELHGSSYKRADADLNGDGRKEVLLYVTDPLYCGSGGCNLVILTLTGTGYRVIMRATITQLPITLLPTSTRGWRDVGVTVHGGGIVRPYTARLRFDGRRYPNNPTALPAVPHRGPPGRVLIDR